MSLQRFSRPVNPVHQKWSAVVVKVAEARYFRPSAKTPSEAWWNGGTSGVRLPTPTGEAAEAFGCDF